MKKRLFGTDGVRGIANQNLTPELCFQLGQAAGQLIISRGLPKRVVLGRDTRKSGPMLGASLAAGFCSVGVNVLSLGVVPTGCISYVARTGGYGMGAVLSASHNPAPDNGVKLIGSDGRKISDEDELSIESALESNDFERPTGGDVGLLESGTEKGREEIERYLDYLETLVPERLDGMKIAVDTANGAAYELAPEILRRLGAVLTVTGDCPDGMNINEEGGATKPATIQTLTKETQSMIGIAFDGDADRAVFSDHEGRLINGDKTMALWCAHWRNDLEPPIVVGTVMTNGGFEAYLRKIGVTLERVDVGDKYVSQRLIEHGGKIGGEQSGHIIFPDRGPTGDGLITALEVLRVLKRESRTAAEFYGDYENWPQLLVNVSVASKQAFVNSKMVACATENAREMLGERGRINVRPSGTQPMVRVMVEADEYPLRDQAVDQVVQALMNDVGGTIYSRVDLTHALGD